ncbi:phospholipase A2 inhibitor gamma subunit B-like [Hypanus sabinus]|uniref:phospholipase A2 inhibitor gamma subunit B-like n=1 Tax=Hypanus sabinus TaxID=79690 RepID=UPI0028C3BBA8|nr:phospholipase A2 inhibitor gamma subunit B-like [Hypanus sabinus]
MMRTLLALALFLGLIAQGHSLQCYACDSSRENCGLGQRNVTCNDTLNLTCITITIRTKLLLPNSGFIEVQRTLFGCGICTDVISFNSGRTSVFVHTACCNSDLCNSQVEPEKENMTLNGLECEGCLTLTETACNQSMAAVSCHGEQNRCIHATSIIGKFCPSTLPPPRPSTTPLKLHHLVNPPIFWVLCSLCNLLLTTWYFVQQRIRSLVLQCISKRH